MARLIDINCDMGEGFGPYRMGCDHDLAKYISSANVACGFHAGDPSVMAEVLRVAKLAGIGIGAHPGFPDLQGFGRRPMHMSAFEIENLVAYQVGALQAMATCQGLTVTHVKPHGALSNMAADDFSIASAIARAIANVEARLIFLVPVRSQMQIAAEKLGLPFVREGFADRAYAADGGLASRTRPGALIVSAEQAARQALRMVFDGEVVSLDGSVVKTEIDSICVHGDAPTAVEIVRSVRNALVTSGIEIRGLGEIWAARNPRDPIGLTAPIGNCPLELGLAG